MSPDDEEPEQTTTAGASIPIPSHEQVMGDLGKAAKPPPRRIDLTPRLERHEVIMDWLHAHADDADACNAMKTWAKAVLSGGAQVANGGFTRKDGKGQPFYYAAVPGTDAMVVFYERLTVPIRTIVFVDIVDWPSGVVE